MSFDLAGHARKFAPVYGENEFSDHLPMTVTALRALGADEARVEAFAKTYAKRLKRKKVGKTTIDPLLLSARIGDPTVYPAALNHFTSSIEEDGRADTLARYLPELTESVGAAAFHGVIRLAYGLVADEDAEIAAGLAYWWSRAETVRFARSIGAANDNAQTTLEDVAEAFRKQRKKLVLDQPTISERIAAVVAEPRIGSVLTRAAAADVDFDQIAATALRIYLASGDFTAIHCVTGVHAARVVCDNVVMNDAAMRKPLWSGICAAYASIGAPTLEPLTPAPTGLLTWGVISSAAQSSDDEHHIKFVYSAQEESRFYGRDAHYRAAAARCLGLDQ